MTKPQVQRVVFDCNLFLQAVGKGGNHAFRCLQLAMDGEVTLCVSEQVLAEVVEVLRRPLVREMFPMLDDDRVDSLVAWLREFAEVIDPVPHEYDYPDDPKDEPYIDLAIAADATFLVSWDKHIIRLGDKAHAEGRRFMQLHPSVNVMDPQRFLKHHFSTR